MGDQGQLTSLPTETLARMVVELREENERLLDLYNETEAERLRMWDARRDNRRRYVLAEGRLTRAHATLRRLGEQRREDRHIVFAAMQIVEAALDKLDAWTPVVRAAVRWKDDESACDLNGDNCGEYCCELYRVLDALPAEHHPSARTDSGHSAADEGGSGGESMRGQGCGTCEVCAEYRSADIDHGGWCEDCDKPVWQNDSCPDWRARNEP